MSASDDEQLLRFLFQNIAPARQKRLLEQLGVRPDGDSNWEAFRKSVASGEVARLYRSAQSNPFSADVKRFLEQNKPDAALDLIRANGGVFLNFFVGVEEAEHCVDLLRIHEVEDPELIHLASAANALKRGAASHARFLLQSRYGAKALDFSYVISRPAQFSLPMRLFSLLLSTYEARPITGQTLENVWALLGELEPCDYLHRGLVYNALLVLVLASGDRPRAEEYSIRAAHHYGSAYIPYLLFFVHIHRAILNLEDGVLTAAREQLEHARAALGEVRFDCPAERRICSMLEAICDYEFGQTSPIRSFVANEFRDFHFGENWPQLSRIALRYAAHATREEQGPQQALKFIEQSKVILWRDRRSVTETTLLEAEILQSDGRWNAALKKLSAIRSRINFIWVESAQDALRELDTPLDIEQAFDFLRHIVWHNPKRRTLNRQIQAFQANPRLLTHQRQSLAVWSAYLLRKQRDFAGAAQQLQAVLGEVGMDWSVSYLSTEKPFLTELLETRVIASTLERYDDVQMVLGRLRQLRSFATPVDGSPLTRQERRVLNGVARGASNKIIGFELQIAEATVKYHLNNIFKKLNCRSRHQAISIARTQRWVD